VYSNPIQLKLDTGFQPDSFCGTFRAWGQAMPAYVTREEFKVLQNEIEGEKLVTRHILQQTQLNSNDLATIMKQLEGVDLKALVRKVDNLEMRFSAFVRDFPATVAEIMREVLRERDDRNK
jgi:hypothetical protein